jgi:hypothetical protein
MPTNPAPRRAYKPTLDPLNPPPRVTRALAAELLLAALGIVVSPRTLESWPLATRIVNGHATPDTAEILARGRAMLDGSPILRGGRTRKAA